MDNSFKLPHAVAHILLGDDSEDVFTADQMQAYARAAVEAEREACAKMCEDRAGTASMFATVAEARSHGATVRGCAAAIRARGKS